MSFIFMPATEHVDTSNMLTSTAVDVDIHPHFQYVKLFYGFDYLLIHKNVI